MIVITAPSGDIGSQVLAKLLDSGERIRVVARHPARLPERARQRVEVVEGSHSERAVVMTAFEGADSVFWLVPGEMTAASGEAAYVDFARPACEAFKACGVKRVVGISALGRGWPRDAGHVTATLKMDDMIADTGVAYRALACSSLMENVLRQIDLIKNKGAYYWTHPADLKIPTVTTRDVAAVAARLLLDPSWRSVDSVPMIGPEDLSCNDMMGIVSGVLGKPLHYHQMSMDELRAMMISRGASAGMTQAMVNMMIAKNEGMDNMISNTSSTLSDTPTTFRQWCEAVLKPRVMA